MKLVKLLPLIGGALVLGACSESTVLPATEREKNVAPESIRLGESAAQVYVGKDYQMWPLVIMPVKAYDAELVYTTGNPSIATVNDSGLVTGVSAGYTTVTVAYKENTRVCASIDLYVYDKKGVTTKDSKDAFKAQQDLQNAFTLNRFQLSYIAHEDEYLDGVLQTHEDFYLTMVYSIEEAYFEYNMYYEETKCVDGQISRGARRYAMYTNETYDTFFFAESFAGTTKNYTSISTNDYIGKPRVEALHSVIANFFSSGMELLDQNLDALYEDSLLNAGVEGNSIKEAGIAPDFASSYYTQSQRSTVPADKESEYKVPAGTPYVWDLTLRNVWKDGVVRLQDRTDVQTFTFEDGSVRIDNSVQIMTFLVNDEFVLTYPSTDDYNHVDDVSDL